MRRTLTLGLLLCACAVQAQPPGPPGGFGPPPTPRAAAQVDITGNWVALVTEDWLWRMVTPAKGDVTSVPVNPNGRRVAGEWDLERDNANSEQCKAFGAAGLMRMPLRLRIAWEDDATLRIDTDAGEQTRLLHFGGDPAPQQEPSWQGYSAAQWTRPVGGFNMRMVFGGERPLAGPPMAALKVSTTHMRAGYLRKNGIPYSDTARLTEYFSRMTAGGNDYLVVMAIVDDPVYLTEPFVTSSHFKKEADATQWSPSPCYTAAPAAEGQ